MILDTGASGLVMTPEAAEQLGLEPFGEVHAASISGKVSGQMLLPGGKWCLGEGVVLSAVG
jgi:hypothetical protein